MAFSCFKAKHLHALYSHLASQTGLGSLVKVLSVFLGELDNVRDSVEVGDSDLAGTLESVCNANGVNAAIQQMLSLLQESSCHDCRLKGKVQKGRERKRKESQIRVSANNGHVFTALTPLSIRKKLCPTYQRHQWYRHQSHHPETLRAGQEV